MLFVLIGSAFPGDDYSDFLGKPLSEQVIKRIAKQCSFNEMANNSEAYSMMTQDNKLPNFLRKGQVGGWKEDFTPELSAKFESEFLSKLEGSGLHFAFE